MFYFKQSGFKKQSALHGHGYQKKYNLYLTFLKEVEESR